jgi:pimeloyl-ACP methyl ester carboxylesterase
MPDSPIILVPGFWLGAWAWDDVAGILRAEGRDVTALTLPGLESVEADRSGIGLADHVDAIVRAIEATDEPVVLALHSATGISGYAATDRVPDRIAAVIYVDSAPGRSPLDPGFAAAEKPLDWADVAAEENLDGLTDDQIATFRARAVPVPGAVLRDTVELTNDARRDIPSTILCTGFPSDQVKKAVANGDAWLAGVPELRNLTWIDLPTSHWPMWSRPADTARVIGEVAAKVAPVGR